MSSQEGAHGADGQLAEALLRPPDKYPRSSLIRDKRSATNRQSHIVVARRCACQLPRRHRGPLFSSRNWFPTTPPTKPASLLPLAEPHYFAGKSQNRRSAQAAWIWRCACLMWRAVLRHLSPAQQTIAEAALHNVPAAGRKRSCFRYLTTCWPGLAVRARQRA